MIVVIPRLLLTLKYLSKNMERTFEYTITRTGVMTYNQKDLDTYEGDVTCMLTDDFVMNKHEVLEWDELKD